MEYFRILNCKKKRNWKKNRSLQVIGKFRLGKEARDQRRCRSCGEKRETMEHIPEKRRATRKKGKNEDCREKR